MPGYVLFANMSEVKKRSRAINFLPSEHKLLIELVDKHKNVVENKKTDAVSNEKKNAGWTKLAEEFNMISGTYPRTAVNLKSKFDNIKRRTKKIITAEKNERFKTGGGTPYHRVPYIPRTDPEVEKIRSIMGVGLDGLVNCRDSNGIRSSMLETEKEGSIIFDSDLEIDLGILDEDDDSLQVQTENFDNGAPSDWSTWSPAALKTPVTAVLARKQTKNQITSKPNLSRNRPKLGPQANSKIKAATQISQCALSKLKQNRLKCRLMKEVVRRQEERLEEIHALNVTALKLDIEIKKARLAKVVGKRNRKKTPQPFEIVSL